MVVINNRTSNNAGSFVASAMAKNWQLFLFLFAGFIYFALYLSLEDGDLPTGGGGAITGVRMDTGIATAAVKPGVRKTDIGVAMSTAAAVKRPHLICLWKERNSKSDIILNSGDELLVTHAIAYFVHYYCSQ